MVKKYVYLYIAFGIFFGFLYALIPMYINVIFVQKIVEYAVARRLSELLALSLLSAAVIIIAELLNSIYENIIKPELKIKIHSEVLSFYIDSLKNVDGKDINDENSYNSLRLIEEKAFEQRIEISDHIVSIILRISVLVSLTGFLVHQNLFLTMGIMVYSMIMYVIGKRINLKKFNFQLKKQELVTEKEVLTNFYLLPEYEEYIRDEGINRKIHDSFKSVCRELAKENKKFFKKIFMVNLFVTGTGSVLVEYISLLILGYIKISKRIISMAQFLAYYRAIDVMISGIDFVLTGVRHLHLNRTYFACEKKYRSKSRSGPVMEFKSLQLKDITFRAENKIILNEISLKIAENDKVAVIGRNASGKTTLLKIISNIYEVGSGKIILNQEADGCKIQYSCYVPAETVFFQWEKIETDFFDAFAVHSGYYDAVKVIERVKQFLNHAMLSEGEKKILMIMRAFSVPNALIVLDEPFANLDENWKEIIKDLIFESLRAVIFSTHDFFCIEQCTAVYEIENHKCSFIGGNVKWMR